MLAAFSLCVQYLQTAASPLGLIPIRLGRLVEGSWTSGLTIEIIRCEAVDQSSRLNLINLDANCTYVESPFSKVLAHQ